LEYTRRFITSETGQLQPIMYGGESIGDNCHEQALRAFDKIRELKEKRVGICNYLGYDGDEDIGLFAQHVVNHITQSIEWELNQDQLNGS
jgi:hypothetical protein